MFGWIIFVIFNIAVLYDIWGIAEDEWGSIDEDNHFFAIMTVCGVLYFIGGIFYDDSKMKIIESEEVVLVKKEDIFSIREPVNMVRGFFLGITSDMQYVMYIRNTDGSKTLRTVISDKTRVYDENSTVGFGENQIKPYYTISNVFEVKKCDRKIKDTRGRLNKFLWSGHYCDYYTNTKELRRIERKIFVPKGTVRQRFSL